MLEVRDVAVSYGLIRALRGVSISIRAGEIFALVGANGAGKTTLLRAIVGLARCTAGSIKLLGVELSGAPTHARMRAGISIVPEGRGLFPEFTVEENLRVGAFVRSDRRRIDADFERVYALYPKLRERRRQLAGALSGGEAQMLALGRALMSQPKLLLLDEPSMGLMPTVVSEVFSTIRMLKRDGLSVFVVEQNAKKALAVADRAAVLQVGEVVIQGTPQSLLQDEHVRRAYLGAGASRGTGGHGPLDVAGPL